jgi:purine-nucleoside phosphorylase
MMKRPYKQAVLEAAQFIERVSGRSFDAAILTGTGLGDSVEFLENRQEIDYREIPNFPVSTVESHAGKLITGHFSKSSVLAFKGRFHLYEGYSPQEVTFPIRIMQELGTRHLILSNASGGLNPEFLPGDIMMISDHINLTGENPLVGPNESDWGERFPDMAFAYHPELIQAGLDSADESCGIIRKGVYAGLKGPSLETPAEIRFLQIIGADAVGFSTVQEVIAAVHAGIQVLALSIITNVHHPEAPVPATVKEIIDVAQTASPKLVAILKSVLETLYGT